LEKRCGKTGDKRLTKTVPVSVLIWYNINMIPKYVRPFLWSYDIKKIDKEKNKKRIITNVLNLGTQKATDWLRKNYSSRDIKEAIINPLPGEWDKKSLNLWSIVFKVKPSLSKKKKCFIMF
jgi:hypothetical protein